MIQAGQQHGLRVACEASADRAYERDGSLRSRNLPDALIEDNARCLQQVLDIVIRGYVIAYDGTRVPIQADTLCIHSDTPGAAERAAALRQGLLTAGVQLTGF